jgi:H/ACA ribonucleoprotein complex subunit 3
MRHLLKCTVCSNYTLSENCKCGGKAVFPVPPKYSPEDKYGGYRRKGKHVNLKEKGLI